jgi:hypothetical protein
VHCNKLVLLQHFSFTFTAICINNLYWIGEVCQPSKLFRYLFILSLLITGKCPSYLSISRFTTFPVGLQK